MHGMEVAALILQFVQALAWPLVVVVLLVLLRVELRALAGRLTGAELPGVKLAFQNQVLKARIEAEESGAILEVEEEKKEGDGPEPKSVDPQVGRRSVGGGTVVGRDFHAPDTSEWRELARGVEEAGLWPLVSDDWRAFVNEVAGAAYAGGWLPKVPRESRDYTPELLTNTYSALGLPRSWLESAIRLATHVMPAVYGRHVDDNDIDAAVNASRTIDELRRQFNNSLAHSDVMGRIRPAQIPK